jgi:hypothetical protein
MCGASLLEVPTAAVPAQSASSPANSATQTVAATKTLAAPVATRQASGQTPIISGPSFLGLNQPAPLPPRKRASLSIDPHSANPRNLDYLLEEDDEPKAGGGWKFVFMIVALALAVGLGYLRWRNHGFDGLKSDAGKPAAQSSETPDSSSAAPAATNSPNPSPPVPSTSQPAASVPAPNKTAQPATDSTPPPAAGQGSAPASADTPAPASTPPSAATNPSATPQPPAADNSAADSPSKAEPEKQPAATKYKDNKNDKVDDSVTKASPAKDSDSDAPDDTPAAAEKPEPTPVAKGKPSAAVSRPAPVDPVAEAQRYLYGKAASQDCERGLRILKPAAEQANPKAMVEMGALYSAGLCTPRDLPTAYRWFAHALRKDPDNQQIQTDLEKLWGEMTQPERQLAIRLSQ